MKELKWRDILTRTFLVIVTTMIIVWSMPHDSRSYFHVEQGKPWKYSEFTAPFDFPIYKSDAAIREERDSASRQYEPYYKYNKEVEVQMVQKFNSDYADCIPDLPPHFMTIISNRLQSLYQQGIIDQKDYTDLLRDTTNMIRIVNEKEASSVSVMEVYSPKLAYEQLFQDEKLAPQRTILQKCNLNEYITPNLIYDKERSEASLNELQNSIPKTTCCQALPWQVALCKKDKRLLTEEKL